MRLKKHQVLLRLGHPIMRQAMATLCRQLHDPEGSQRHLPLVHCGAAHAPGFEALLVFHYTRHRHQRIAGAAARRSSFDGLPHRGRPSSTPLKTQFKQTVLQSEFHPIKSCKRQDEWVRTLRGHWFQHKAELEAFLRPGRSRDADQVFDGRAERRAQAGTAMPPRRATATGSRNCRTAAGNRNLTKLAKELLATAGRGHAADAV